MNAPSPGRWSRPLLLAVWGLSALWAFQNLDRGWIPHDEGTLAQSAQRVLEGELPHKDFDELYTGGLSAMNAVAFRILGDNLLTPRLVLFAFFLAWIPTLFYVVTRFTTPVVAALATLLAVTWSIPNYPAAMPSWYNLFFAVFGLAALLRHSEAGARRWLFLAGLAAGLSVLIKTSGLFLVAAGLLVLANAEQMASAAKTGGPSGASPARSPFFSGVTTLLLITFIVLLGGLVGLRAGAAGVLRFILPLGGVSAVLVWNEWSGRPRGPARARAAQLMELSLPFLGGVLIPVALLVLVYAAQGATGDLARGLFETPLRRLSFAAAPPPPLTTWWVALPVLALLAVDRVPLPRLRQVVAALVVAGGLVAAALPSARALLPPVWYFLNALGPLVCLAGIAWLAVARRREVTGLRRQQALATLAVAGAVLLIQFPFAGPIYVFYALPAVVLAVSALWGEKGVEGHPVLAAVVVFLTLFSARWINSGDLFVAGAFGYDPTVATERLALPRAGGLRVSPHDKEQYERLVVAMQELSGSAYTFATPDLPEVYYLSGLRNPTPTLFDFFDDPQGRTARILAALDANGVNVVVLNRRLRFSGPPADDLLEGLRARYPQATIIGDFILRWRPLSGSGTP